MKVSFIIPAHNEEDQILIPIKSIYNQQNLAKNDFEIIVVDNNSTDNTARVVKDNFPEVKVLFEKNQGTGWARNAGAEIAEGEILAFFDADNEAPPDWTPKILNEFQKNPKLVAVSGPYHYRNTWWITEWAIKLNYILIFKPTEFVFKNFLKKGAFSIGGNLAIKHKAFKQIHGFDTRFTFWGDDTDIARRLLKIGDVKFINSIYVYSSTRRLEKEGYFTIFLHYAVNFYWVIYFDKPFTTKLKNPFLNVLWLFILDTFFLISAPFYIIVILFKKIFNLL